MLNKILGGIVLLVLIGAGAYYFTQMRTTPPANNNNSNQVANQPTPPPPPPPPASPTTPESAVATIETSEGTFKVTLDGKAAPKTVANFIKLANEDYYVNTKFHRIVANFMVQAGDPNSKDDDPENDGQGGPGYTVPAEIGLKHKKGAIAMARLGDQVNPTKASSGSQFYVVLEENEITASLDGSYTVFGYVTSGMDVVTKIGNTPTEPNPFTGEQSLPLKAVTIKKITIQ
ncbi:MAG TPA: peptidylprolyl isomerase [Verrucomicrobiae bacterium]|nr:peptidylprolyl isomerase [Verrucomicrobiae bacterium]